MNTHFTHFTRFRHFRAFPDENVDKFKAYLHNLTLEGIAVPHRCKAVTECSIEVSVFGKTATGFAFCGPHDYFCKKRGRQIAEGRALKKLNAADL